MGKQEKRTEGKKKIRSSFTGRFYQRAGAVTEGQRLLRPNLGKEIA